MACGWRLLWVTPGLSSALVALPPAAALPVRSGCSAPCPHRLQIRLLGCTLHGAAFGSKRSSQARAQILLGPRDLHWLVLLFVDTIQVTFAALNILWPCFLKETAFTHTALPHTPCCLCPFLQKWGGWCPEAGPFQQWLLVSHRLVLCYFILGNRQHLS